MCDIGDVDAQTQMPILQSLQRNRVIEVTRVGGIDSDHGHTGKIISILD